MILQKLIHGLYTRFITNCCSTLTCLFIENIMCDCFWIQIYAFVEGGCMEHVINKYKFSSTPFAN